MAHSQSIVVTGGRGLIGSHVVRKLVELGHWVTVIDNLSRYDETIVGAQRWQQMLASRMLLTTGARATTDTIPMPHRHWVDAVGGGLCDTLIHLAAVPRQAIAAKMPEVAARTMIQGLINTLEYVKEERVKRVVFVSSSMVYGNFSSPVSEDAPLAPIGLYGILKLAGERIVRDYAEKVGFEAVIVRPTAVYGPTDLAEDRVIPRFFDQAMAGGELVVNGADERLDFTYVDDIVDGIILASMVDKAADRTYNISYGRAELISDAARIVTDLVGNGRVVVAGKQEHFPSRDALDITAAKRDLGYNPVHPIATGLAKQYQWLLQNQSNS